MKNKWLETSGGWVKYEANPVMGGKYGTCFDISVLKEGGIYRMWLSWRPQKSLAIVDSKDGIHWSEPPKIVLEPRKETGWEDIINRPGIVKRADGYHLWYTGQTKDHSSIGYATSPDGVVWKRMSDKPVLSPDQPWENVTVMCPHVIWDEQEKVFKMWYSGGDNYEPDAIGYATSKDGLTWIKSDLNPVFKPAPENAWEKDKVTGAQIEKHGDWYLMFYIGFETTQHAQIGLARSRDGITGWERHQANPIIRTSLRGSANDFDSNACYKPYAIFDGTKWLLWYNGRHGEKEDSPGGMEQIGVAFHEGEDLGFLGSESEDGI
ncbi:MAG: family 43 glycosylhydrolase [Lentisphaerota bacterium]